MGANVVYPNTGMDSFGNSAYGNNYSQFNNNYSNVQPMASSISAYSSQNYYNRY